MAKTKIMRIPIEYYNWMKEKQRIYSEIYKKEYNRTPKKISFPTLMKAHIMCSPLRLEPFEIKLLIEKGNKFRLT